MIYIKTPSQVAHIRYAANVISQFYKEIKATPLIGLETSYIEELAYKFLDTYDASPAFKGVDGYKYATCVSVNKQVIHGYPSKYKINYGDLVSIDFGVTHKGYNADAAITLVVGQGTTTNEYLVSVTKLALYSAISEIKPYKTIKEVEEVIESCARDYGVVPVKNYTGHGIGKILHEDPHIRNYDSGNTTKLLPGMVICVEPIFMDREDALLHESNGWTVYTQEAYSAHFEHTVLVTEQGCEILSEEV